MAESIKKKAVKGMLWSLIQRFSNVGIQFISGIILARLLTPSDYGAIGMLLIFMTVAQAFMDCGFGAALIQRKHPTQEDYSTIFWWNICMSLVLYGIMYVISPIVANFYHMPILCKVLRVQSLVLIISAISLIQHNQLRKNLCFKKITIVNLIASVISLSVTIYMAYHGYGIWSLVAQNLLMSLIPAFIYWTTNNWFPSLCFSMKSLKSLFSFGVFVFLTNLISGICDNIQGLLIGRFFSASVMGFYAKARSTERIASLSISEALRQVIFPLYSELQDDKTALVNLIKLLTRLVSFVIFPFMFLLILLAKPIFLLLYSDRWLESVPFFQALCLLGLSGCLQSINTQTIAAIGKSKSMFKWTLVKRLIGLCVVLVGLVLGGIWGMIVGTVLQGWFSYFINIALVSKYVGYKFNHQLMDILPTLILSVVCFSLTFITAKFIDSEMYINAIAAFVQFLSMYILLAYVFKMEAFIILINKVKARGFLVKK